MRTLAFSKNSGYCRRQFCHQAAFFDEPISQPPLSTGEQLVEIMLADDHDYDCRQLILDGSGDLEATGR